MTNLFERWRAQGIDIEREIAKSRGAYVKVTPDFFWIAEPQHYRSRVVYDCWLMIALAGDMTKAWDHEPFPLPWYAFERQHHGRNRLSIWPRARLKTLTCRHRVFPSNHVEEVALTFTD